MPSHIQQRMGVSQLTWTTAIIGWSAAVVAMLWWVTSYEFSAYETAAAAVVTHWPADTELKLSTERPTLLLFMHPKCPCTRASLAELHKLLEGSTLTASELPEVTVVVSQPAGTDREWSDTGTVYSASLLPNATLTADAGGFESDRFGVHTSGTVLLFDRTGRRLFAGGVTASRGHEGDSVGGVTLRRLLKQDATVVAPIVPTFGCKLCSAQEPATSCHAAPVSDESMRQE